MKWPTCAASPIPSTWQPRSTAAWWNDFWKRSWIFVVGGPAATVSGGRPQANRRRAATRFPHQPGLYPATLDHGLSRAAATTPSSSTARSSRSIRSSPAVRNFNADWRRWGDAYWWQNTRLPYFPMIARGDWDEVQTLFRCYRDAPAFVQSAGQALLSRRRRVLPRNDDQLRHLQQPRLRLGSSRARDQRDLVPVLAIRLATGAGTGGADARLL